MHFKLNVELQKERTIKSRAIRAKNTLLYDKTTIGTI